MQGDTGSSSCSEQQADTAAADAVREAYETIFGVLFKLANTPADRFNTDQAWAQWMHREACDIFTNAQELRVTLSANSVVDAEKMLPAKPPQLRAGELVSAAPAAPDIADTLRTLLQERNHRTDGDLQALAERCLHLSRGDRDLISMRGRLITQLDADAKRAAPALGAPDGWSDAYAAFKGAFDTPAARRRDSSDYAQDARDRLRAFNDAMLATARKRDANPEVNTRASKKPTQWPSSEFETWFAGIERGDGSIPVPQSAADGQAWFDYIGRRAIALGAWEAAIESQQPAAVRVADEPVARRAAEQP